MGCGGTFLESQHYGNGGRKVILSNAVTLRLALAKDPCSNKQSKSQNKVEPSPNPMILMILLLSGKINQSNINFKVTVNHIETRQ